MLSEMKRIPLLDHILTTCRIPYILCNNYIILGECTQQSIRVHCSTFRVKST